MTEPNRMDWASVESSHECWLGACRIAGLGGGQRAGQETASCCSRQRSRAAVGEVSPAGQRMVHLGVAKPILAQRTHDAVRCTRCDSNANAPGRRPDLQSRAMVRTASGRSS